MVLQTLSNQLSNWKIGDNVKVNCRKEEIYDLQDGHGGWSYEMEESFTNLGKVCGFNDDGDIEVSYPSGNRWTFNPLIFETKKTIVSETRKIKSSNASKLAPQDYPVQSQAIGYWKPGDFVEITLDPKSLKKLQFGHGGWDNSMQEALEDVGTVFGYDEDGNLEVSYPSGSRWTFNPQVFTHAENIENLCADHGSLQECKACLETPEFVLIPCYHLARCTGCALSDKSCAICGQSVKEAKKLGDLICDSCDELPAAVLFKPCKHLLLCNGCSRKNKKCSHCKEGITEKVSLLSIDDSENDKKKLEDLEKQLKEFEEQTSCNVCLDLPKKIVFKPCGHCSCHVCCEQLSQCPLCRKEIEEKLPFYL